MKSWAALIIVGIIFAGVTMHKEQSRAGANISSDEAVILQASEAIINGNRKVSFKFGASLDAEKEAGALERQAREICAALDLAPQLAPSASSAEPTNSCAGQPKAAGNSLAAAELRLTRLADGTGYLFVHLRAETSAEIEAAHNKKLAADAIMQQRGIQGAWNTIVSGAITDTQEATLKSLQTKLDLSEVERYKDAGISVYAYNTPKLQAGIASGKQRISLQVALWRNSETGERSITLGTPVITGEMTHQG